MLLKQSIIAALMASVSVALALPAADVVNLAVRGDDYGVEYKRSESPVEMFVCKRGENQSLSCLRKKSDADQSETANI